MSKAPKMPRVPDDDGIERHSAYTRMNPMGHKEFVPDDDEETLNELSEDLMECAEEFIWKYVHEHLPQSILERPDTDDKIDAAIGRGEGPDTIIKMFKESVSFGGPLPTGGGAGSPEQLQSDRRHNRLVASSGDQTREAGEDVNNFTASTPQASDGPELSRAKSTIRTSTIRGTKPRNKYITGSEGDGLDGATRNESFTGTGAIAISPGGGYNFVDDDDEDDDDQDPEKQTESNMTAKKDVLTEQINQVLAEWEPSFKSGEYSPGDYQMPSPTGDGVAERKPKKDKVGKYDTDTSQSGKEWPRDHKDTEAMSSVSDDGTDDGSGGYHDSSVGDPKDGHQSETGHNWPDEAKNTGSGVAEPFEGDRWSDGGTLKGGSAQDEMDNAGTDQKMPSDGPITGTSGPQLGQPSESWSPKNMAALMEGDVALQDLFDSYARDYEMVCVEDFQALCNAHGAGATIDETSLLQLMESNQQFIFYQGEDANGPYWTPTPIAENVGAATAGIAAGGAVADAMDDDEDEEDVAMEGKPFPGAAPPFGSDGDDEEEDDDDDEDCAMESKKPWEDDEEGDEEEDDCSMESVQEGENRRPFGKTISELQVRPAAQEAQPYGGIGPGGRRPMGDPDFGGDIMGDVTDDLGAGSYDDKLGAARGIEAQEGPGPFGAGCPECGAPDTGEAACPECGVEMGMAPEEEAFGGETDPVLATSDEYMDWEDRAMDQGGYYAHDAPYDESTMENSPAIMENLHNFMQSARRILENNQEFSPQHIGEALRYSWAYHARNVNPQKTPTKVRATLESMAKRFPVFAMVVEGGSDAMESAGGTAIGTGGNASNSSDHLPKTDTEMKDEGEPLGASQENDLEGTPEIKGTAKGMDGKGSVAQAVKENVARLSNHVQKAIREGAKSLRGKYNVQFSLLVTEGKSKNRTPLRQRLAEALADAEELLQLHKAENVELEASFADAKGAVVLKHNVPLLTIKPRGLLTSEGKALFRFQRNAENFANELVVEGYTCRVIGHNWGRAVVAKTPITIAEQVFRTLTEKKKWMQDVKSTGECTPMTKSTCTGRKKAFAKRVQKGGDLHQ